MSRRRPEKGSDGVPVPFYRARRPSRLTRGGRCYPYAFQEALRYVAAVREDRLPPDPTMVIVHGVIDSPAFGVNNVDHAWIERGGYAYDWQMIAFKEAPIPLAEFYERHSPRDMVRYTPEQLVRLVVKTGNAGPWDGSASTGREGPS